MGGCDASPKICFHERCLIVRSGARASCQLRWVRLSGQIFRVE
jgi:hypothetical protein